jgi:hypothetical protein
MSDVALSAASDLPKWLVAALSALPQAIADAKANVAPPAPLSAGSIADMLDEANAELPALVAALRAHQGELTGAAVVLHSLAVAGAPYAEAIRQIVLEAPIIMAAAEIWLPRALLALRMFSPSPPPQPGGMGAGPRIGRG